MQIYQRPLSDIKPYEKNPRQKYDIQKVAQSIKEFGFQQPIVVDRAGVIIVGHGRYQASKSLGLETVPVIIADLPPEKAKAYRIADNKTNEYSDWDIGLLQQEFTDLLDINYDLELTGFDADELEKLIVGEKEGLTDEDAVPETPEEPKAQLGDIYKLGEHRLMCGDTLDNQSINFLMNEKKANMIFTDPPYGMNLKTDYTSLNWGDRKGKNYSAVIGDNEDFKPELIKTIFDNFDYCEEIFLWGADYYYKYIKNFDSGHYIVWDKTLESNGDAGSNSEFELLWTKNKHKRKVIHFNWFRYFGLSKQDIKTREHPTQKPLQVCIPFIEKYSKEQNIIVDLYGGSGSTLLACEKTNRKCYMMELDPKYIDVIIKRWEQYTGQKAQKIN